VNRLHNRYWPVDELLTDPSFMILRAVRRFDWADSSDIAIALNVPSKDVDHQRRNSFDVLCRGCIGADSSNGSANRAHTATGSPRRAVASTSVSWGGMQHEDPTEATR